MCTLTFFSLSFTQFRTTQERVSRQHRGRRHTSVCLDVGPVWIEFTQLFGASFLVAIVRCRHGPKPGIEDENVRVRVSTRWYGHDAISTRLISIRCARQQMITAVLIYYIALNARASEADAGFMTCFWPNPFLFALNFTRLTSLVANLSASCFMHRYDPAARLHSTI